MNLAQHRVLITGGTRGIGFALAKALMARGATIAICGRSARRLDEIQEQLPSLTALPCDLADLDSLAPFVERVRSSFGSPTVLVNNAGIQFNHSFDQALRYQLEPHPNVRIVEVLPPLVDTGMTEGRGKGKISAERAAEEIVSGLERDLNEIYIGKAKFLRVLHHLAPGALARLMKNG